MDETTTTQLQEAASSAEVNIAPDPLRYFATLDEHGRVTANYPSDVYPIPEGEQRNPNIPAGAIELPYDVYDALKRTDTAYIKGVDGSYTLQPYTPPPAPVVVPTQITKRQFELAVYKANASDYTRLMAWLAQAPMETQIEYRATSVIERENPALIAGAKEFGWTDAAVDQLFIIGSNL